MPVTDAFHLSSVIGYSLRPTFIVSVPRYHLVPALPVLH